MVDRQRGAVGNGFHDVAFVKWQWTHLAARQLQEKD
jgi:hypothetical protein